jgi:hypothetical protein
MQSVGSHVSHNAQMIKINVFLYSRKAMDAIITLVFVHVCKRSYCSVLDVFCPVKTPLSSSLSSLVRDESHNGSCPGNMISIQEPSKAVVLEI